MSNTVIETSIEKTETVISEGQAKEKVEVLFTFARKGCGCGGNCNGSCK